MLLHLLHSYQDSEALIAQDKTKVETLESTNWEVIERVALTSFIPLKSPL